MNFYSASLSWIWMIIKSHKGKKNIIMTKSREHCILQLTSKPYACTSRSPTNSFFIYIEPCYKPSF